MTKDTRFAVRHFCFPLLQIFAKIRCSALASSHRSRASDFNSGNRAICHSQKVLRLTRFFLARANALQKFFFRNGIVGFIVIAANAGPCTDQLIYDSVCQWPRRDLLREINYRFAKSSRSLLQIGNGLRIRFFANNWRLGTSPKGTVRVGHCFVLGHSLVIRHTPFVT